MVRLYQFALSGFFAGIAGGLYVLIYEIVTFDTVSAAKSANALLAVYIGGAGGFFGPILGTIVVVLLQSGVSLLSNAWLLYVGVLFIVMVMYAPGGLIGLIFMHMPIWRAGRCANWRCPMRAPFRRRCWSCWASCCWSNWRPSPRSAPPKARISRSAAVSSTPRRRCPGSSRSRRWCSAALWLRREARGFRERWDALMEGAKIQSAAKLPSMKAQEAMS